MSIPVIIMTILIINVLVSIRTFYLSWAELDVFTALYAVQIIISLILVWMMHGLVFA